jgi:hypothetical protein
MGKAGAHYHRCGKLFSPEDTSLLFVRDLTHRPPCPALRQAPGNAGRGDLPRAVTQLASSQCHINMPSAAVDPPQRGTVAAAAGNWYSCCRCCCCCCRVRHSAPGCSTPGPGAAAAGGGDRARTGALLRAKQALSQLSYTPGQMTEARYQISQAARPHRLRPDGQCQRF